MANSPAHKLGQLLGNFIESRFTSILQQICFQRNLYLDVVGQTRAARRGKKVTWEDIYGSKHDLDFVIERFGSYDSLGEPVALIECAWRRYTKHSKNKAQEIQGAVLPIAQKHYMQKPFLGAIIAGDFTAPSITQLNSCGFKTLYFTSDQIFTAFDTHQLNMRYGESTSDEMALSKVQQFESLDSAQLDSVWRTLTLSAQGQIQLFTQELIASLDRRITTIVISPLYGNSHVFHDTSEAMNFLSQTDFSIVPQLHSLQRIFVRVEFGNGDKIEGTFSDALTARNMLSNVITNNP
ncbi:TPA: hypothetical protein NJ327_001819 [Vibrio parahaemolyticus]|nr:hypothetical protein [Vibrio parahaemolyticus]HCM0911908.1 hypothetical protein [Vibrio parahaemolyticus]